ncbi:hypothetical protein [Priestia koreensis]|uniref:hypothetical protein n=1 Tax=Priestia koreensis TaxID=284581 RepID=UPI001F5936CE|nr:hypothetical protein [Priestia koreensis]UNL86888.1 hypothetical protein IE339_10525 [Priestia koreensis]
MMRRKAWIVGSIVVVVAVAVIISIIQAQSKNDEQMYKFIGYSSDGEWKGEYSKQETYWDGTLTPLKKSKKKVGEILFEEGKELEKYSGGEPEEDSNYHFSSLGDAPPKKAKLTVTVKWIDETGSHEQSIHLKKQK